MFLERNTLHDADRHGVSVDLQLILAAGRAQHRMFVSGVCGDTLSGRNLKHRDPNGHEKVGVVALAELIVDAGERFCRAFAVLQAGFYEDTGNHHQERGRHALAGHVRHDESHVIVVDHEEIIKVAAHFLCRRHAGIKAELLPVRKRREQARKLAALNPACHIELGADALLFRCDAPDLVDV